MVNFVRVLIVVANGAAAWMIVKEYKKLKAAELQRAGAQASELK